MDIIFLNSEILFNLEKQPKFDTMVNVNLLKYHSKAKFVLIDETSEPFYRLKDKLFHNGYPIIPIDKVTNVEAEKGHKIDLWIQNNRCNRFVIIDTNEEVEKIRKWHNNVVGVEPRDGINEIKKKISLSFLGKNHKERKGND